MPEDPHSETIVCDNGLTIVLKDLPQANSISFGFYVLAGLLQEEKEIAGIAHFLEHMSFKGTARRSAKQITEAVDYLGGSINAHTSKEYTCYTMTVLPHIWSEALDILGDLVFHSTLNEKDMELERQVVLEEIHMYEDTPDDLIHDVYMDTIWGSSKLGKPILGTVESLKGIDREKMLAFKQHYLNPKNVVISVAGRLEDKAALISEVQSQCQPASDTSRKPFSSYIAKPSAQSQVKLLSKKTEQIHFCLGTQSVPLGHEDQYKVTLLATVLGGSMSSRLFQNIREKRGWAYSVYAYTSMYRHAGLFTVYAGINKDRFVPTMRLILKEFKALQEKCISERELKKVKQQLKGNLILSLERSGAWMSWIGRSQIYYNRIRSVDEIVDAIDRVTVADLQAVAQKQFSSESMGLAAIGPFSEQQKQDLSGEFSAFLTSTELSL